MEFMKDKFPGAVADMIGDLSSNLVFIDGDLVPASAARLAVWDHGFLYGDAVYEGIRAYDGNVFMLDEHIDRLYRSAQSLCISIPLSKSEMKEVIIHTLLANNLSSAHIRPIVTRGTGQPGIDPRRAVRPTVIVIAHPFKALLGLKPLKLITTSIRRKSPLSVPSPIKSTSYIDSILVKLQANAVGADDGLFLDNNGLISEAATANIFVVNATTLRTPHPTSCLPGLTRGFVKEIALERGFEVCDADLTIHDLYTADELFLTGTAAEIVPVREVDGRCIGSGEVGPVTHQLVAEFRKAVTTRYITPISR